MTHAEMHGRATDGGTGDEPAQGALFPEDRVHESSPRIPAVPAVPPGPPVPPVPPVPWGPRGTGSIDGLLDDLNPAQREAITHGEGPLLILAGPGSGKTRVITRRIAWLVTERNVEPWRILAITFTNKAAREMRARVERLLPVRGLWISTFHSMCARILRRDIEMLGGWTRDFTIYDTHDKNQLLKVLLKEANYDIAQFKPSMVGAWISDWKNSVEGSRPQAVADERPAKEQQGIAGEVFVRIRKLYEAALLKNNALDFDDLLCKVHALFEQHPGVRDAYANRFLHVMVDEYQDTNHVQYLLTKSLASAHGNVAVCGDPDQSIYGWRGADVGNILDFEKDFPNPRVVKLEQNYRSTKTVLRAAQAVIERNAQRKPKGLWSEKDTGRKIVALECADENDEAREIAHQIQALQLEGRSPHEVAVFYRVNFMQRALETALRMARIPYQIVGGQEFYERREIRDLVAFAKLVANPRDDVAFRRVVNVPARGIGEKSLESLAQFAADRRIALSEAVRSSEALARVKGRARAGLEDFADLMTRLEPLRDAPAGYALEQILEEIGYEAWLAEMADDSGVDREANVQELQAHADAYDEMVERADQERGSVPGERGEPGGDIESAAAEAREAPSEVRPPQSTAEPMRGGLAGFLQDIALVSDTDDMKDDTNKVTLMTLHSAKGLEFPVVFIAGLEEDLLPHVRAINDVAGPTPERGIEEERRLFYVGLTRAQDRLFLTHTRSRLHFGEFSPRVASRFLGEIPRELVEGYEPDDEHAMLGVYEAPNAADELTVGDRVVHAHFGRGTVERLQGMGANARATVHFPAHGTKTLLLQYAKLERIGKDGR